MYIFVCLVFLFKQKTAYEMRISDWSSDVCSSDLVISRRGVWSLAVAETIVWAGTLYIFPALIIHWEQDLGWSKTTLAGAYTVAVIISAVAAPYAGRLNDAGHGVRLLVLGTVAAGDRQSVDEGKRGSVCVDIG